VNNVHKEEVKGEKIVVDARESNAPVEVKNETHTVKNVRKEEVKGDKYVVDASKSSGPVVIGRGAKAVSVKEREKSEEKPKF